MSRFKDRVMQKLPLNEETILQCAFNHAINARNYNSSIVAAKLVEVHSGMSRSVKRVISEEITRRDELGILGSDYIREDWLKVRSIFDPSNHVRVRVGLSPDKTTIVDAVKHGGKYMNLAMTAEYTIFETIEKNHE
jgi:hypothetical protein